MTAHLSNNPGCRHAQALLDAQQQRDHHSTSTTQQSSSSRARSTSNLQSSSSWSAGSPPPNHDAGLFSPHQDSNSSFLSPNPNSESDDFISPSAEAKDESHDFLSPSIPPTRRADSRHSSTPPDTSHFPLSSPDGSVPPTFLSFPNVNSPPQYDDDYISVNSAVTEPSVHSSSSQNNVAAFHAQHYDLDVAGRTADNAISVQEDDEHSVSSDVSHESDPSMPGLDQINDDSPANEPTENNTVTTPPAPPDDPLSMINEYIQVGYLADGDVSSEAVPPELEACDQTLFQNQQEFIKSTGAKDSATLQSRGYQFAVDLQVILRDAGAPLCVYDKVVDWALRAEKAGLFPGYPRKPEYESDFAIPSRKKLFSNLYKRFNLQAMKPIRTRVLLPNAQSHVWITTFDVKAALLSLLTNPELINDDSLQFCLPGMGPWDRFPADDPRRSGDDPPLSHVYDDIQTGRRYFQAQVKLCSGDRDVLLPIILFIDKTHTDVKGNKTLEPVCMTLGIFKREVRNTHKAWTVIGYIPNKLVYKAAKQAVDRFSDFHVMLEHILKPLKDLLSGPGFRWVFDFAGKKYDSVVKGYLAFVCGDHEGQDKIAGHYLNRTEVKRICRYCDVTLDESDDPYFDFTLTKQSHIDDCIANKRRSVLKELSYYCLNRPRALTGIECGEPDSANAVGYLLPSDILHSNQHGLMDYAKSSLVDSKRQTNKARKQALQRSRAQYQLQAADRQTKRRRTGNRSVASTATAGNDLAVDGVEADNIVEEGDFYAPTAKTSKKDLQKIKIFSNSNIGHWEPILLRLGYLLNQQSDDDRPRTSFPNGVFSLTKVNAQETSGSLLLLLLFISSQYGEYLFADARYEQPAKRRNLGMMGNSRRQQWIQSLQQLLLYEATQKSPNVTQEDTNNLDSFMPHFLTMLKTTFCRGTGQGMKLLKFHVQIHVPRDIRLSGSLSNTDTASGESNHKVICKRTARNTQHRLNKFDYQCAKRFSEDLVLDKAMSLVRRVYWSDSKTKDPPTFTGIQSNVFVATIDGIFNRVGSHKESKNQFAPFTSKRQAWMNDVVDWIDDTLYHEVHQFLCGLNDLAQNSEADESSLCSEISSPNNAAAGFSVQMFTQYYMLVDRDDPSCGRFHYRADPRWDSEKGMQEGRHDWANASLPYNHPVSVELRKQAYGYNVAASEDPETPLASISAISFLRISGVPGQLFYGGSTVSNGDYCLFQAANLASPALDTVPCILYRASKMLKRGRGEQPPMLFLCPMECLVSPAIVVPEPIVDWKSPIRRGSGHSHRFSRAEYLLVEPRDDWCVTFLDHVKDWCGDQEKDSEQEDSSRESQGANEPIEDLDKSNDSTSSSGDDEKESVQSRRLNAQQEEMEMENSSSDTDSSTD